MQHQNEAAAIRNLQRYLRQLSYFDERISAPPIDGIFDTATGASLRDFQTVEKLPVTGVADQVTFERLFLRYQESRRRNNAPVPIAQFPRLSEGYALREGDESFLVRLIQYALGELQLIYEGMDEIPQTGVYDAATAEAVRGLQRRFQLPQTGEVDRETWDALATVYNRTFGGYQPQ